MPQHLKRPSGSTLRPQLELAAGTTNHLMREIWLIMLPQMWSCFLISAMGLARSYWHAAAMHPGNGTATSGWPLQTSRITAGRRMHSGYQLCVC